MLDEMYPTTATNETAGSLRRPYCAHSGNATMLMIKYPDVKVVFSGTRSGEIGSTFATQS